MNASELAAVMLDYEIAQRHANGFKAVIESEVFFIGKTQKVGNVVATYSAGRKKYDYEAAGKDAPQSLIDNWTEPVTDWRAVCKSGWLVAVPFTQGEPSVTVKLLG